MVQVPGVSNVAAQIETVQIVGVVESKLTGSPELAVAVSGTPTEGLAICAAIAAKMMV